jgi:hypothetical protein
MAYSQRLAELSPNMPFFSHKNSKISGLGVIKNWGVTKNCEATFIFTAQIIFVLSSSKGVEWHMALWYPSQQNGFWVT